MMYFNLLTYIHLMFISLLEKLITDYSWDTLTLKTKYFLIIFKIHVKTQQWVFKKKKKLNSVEGIYFEKMSKIFFFFKFF